MPIFKLTKQKFFPIKELRIDLEKDLQKLVEENLDEIFGLKFICSEFSLNSLRADTVAFDEETGSFVIIEYKKDKSSSVIDQGYAYLSLLLNNKADFILEYNERNEKRIKKENIDWSQTKVLFLANDFTAHQKSAINFKDLPIELWEVKKFEHDLILFNQLKSPETSESIKTVTKDKVIEKVTREVKKSTVDDHFGSDWTKSWEIYQSLRDRILAIDSRIVETPRTPYISFKIGKSVLCGVHAHKSKLQLWLGRTKPSDLKDPDKKTVYREKSFEYYNQHITDFFLKETADVDYAIFLIQQLYKKYFQ